MSIAQFPSFGLDPADFLPNSSPPADMYRTDGSAAKRAKVTKCDVPKLEAPPCGVPACLPPVSVAGGMVVKLVGTEGQKGELLNQVRAMVAGNAEAETAVDALKIEVLALGNTGDTSQDCRRALNCSTEMKRDSGANSTVSIYDCDATDECDPAANRIAIRTARVTDIQKLHEDIPACLLRDMAIWIASSILNLSPRIRYIGFYITDSSSHFKGFGNAAVDNLRYDFMIANDAYSRNLGEYLDNHAWGSDPVKEAILQDETVRIINVMTHTMRMMCFDVKPANIVVSDDGQPRFIDWDGDWCKRPLPAGTSPTQAELLMLILLGAHLCFFKDKNYLSGVVLNKLVEYVRANVRHRCEACERLQKALQEKADAEREGNPANYVAAKENIATAVKEVANVLKGYWFVEEPLNNGPQVMYWYFDGARGYEQTGPECEKKFQQILSYSLEFSRQDSQIQGTIAAQMDTEDETVSRVTRRARRPSQTATYHPPGEDRTATYHPLDEDRTATYPPRKRGREGGGTRKHRTRRRTRRPSCKKRRNRCGKSRRMCRTRRR